eukprot:g15042.t1
MGSGASCAERPSTPLDERLRTMLIMRAYNCRPRDWTMKDQFDAVAENGFLTKDNLRLALRLAECPRIEALLHRCNLFDRPAGRVDENTNRDTSTASTVGAASISVADLIAFLEDSARHKQKAATAAAAALSDPKRFHHVTGTGTSTPIVRRDGKEGASGHNSVSGRISKEHMGQEGTAGEASGGEEGEEASKRGGGGHCTTLVRHLGAVLGLRGKDAYRRPGPGQPVWRKRETLIQERIVQYTTLDEEGTVQELFETEKSQTEVLHMECKRTGEFAHSESTHYESGEAFNGEVVLEETGVERYVHLRSVDDEYEHLESTLPTRARNGEAGAAGGVGGNPPAEGVEGGPGDNETGGDVDTVVDGGDSDGRPAAQAEPAEGTSHRGKRDGRNVDGGSEHNSGARSESPRQPQPERQTSSSLYVSPEQRIEIPCRDNDAEPNAALPRRLDAAHGGGPIKPSFEETPLPPGEAAPVGTEGRRHPSPPPSAYHYRSPSCSPRLSPRPMRSPYRQEGVGGRESSGRAESARGSCENGERREESAEPACSYGGAGGDAARRRGHAEGSEHVVGGRKHGDMAGGDDGAKTHRREEKEDEGEEEEGAGGLDSLAGVLACSPLPGPVPSRGDGGNRGASAEGSGGDDVRPDAWSSSVARVAASEGAFVGSTGGGPSDDGLEGAEFGESAGFGEGYEGSVVFIDNQSHEDERGQYSPLAHAEEGWWQPGSGSVLRGVDFAFEEEDDSAAANTAGEMADVFLSCAEQPTTPAMSTSSPTTRPTGDDTDHQFDVTRLVDGLRSGAPRPMASNPRDHVENSADREATLERKSDASPDSDRGRDQEPAAPAPFHSHVWGSKATAAVPYEDCEEGKLARAGVAATSGNSDYSSGPDVAA